MWFPSISLIQSTIIMKWNVFEGIHYIPSHLRCCFHLHISQMIEINFHRKRRGNNSIKEKVVAGGLLNCCLARHWQFGLRVFRARSPDVVYFAGCARVELFLSLNATMISKMWQTNWLSMESSANVFQGLSFTWLNTFLHNYFIYFR